MASPTYTSALVVGAGEGPSASLTRLLREEELAVAIATRGTAKLAPLCTETGVCGDSKAPQRFVCLRGNRIVFPPSRHLLAAANYREIMRYRFTVWLELVCLQTAF